MKFGTCDSCGKTGIVGLIACAETHYCADCAAKRFDGDREKIFDEFRRRLITDYVARVREFGPTRVLINAEGLATSPARAFLEYHKRHDVIFIREDGWSLGASQALELDAFKLWREDWLGVVTVHYCRFETGSFSTELIADLRERKGIKS